MGFGQKLKISLVDAENIAAFTEVYLSLRLNVDFQVLLGDLFFWDEKNK